MPPPPPLLAVDPGGAPNRWRFGRVSSENDALGPEAGELELRESGEYVLLNRHPDALTALLLVRRHDGSPARLLHEIPPPGVGVPTERLSPPVAPAVPVPRRSTAGRAKGGSGETLTDRARREREGRPRA